MTALQKLDARIQAQQSLLCVGLDSDSGRLPQRFLRDTQPQFAFNRHIIAETVEFAAAYKCNMAFYEANGADGWQQLEATMRYLRREHPSLFTICDAKRADIGNTSAAYACAIFDELGFDALTLNPYLGAEALQPFLERQDKACIILCRTSNPGAGELQDLELERRPLWQHVAQKVITEWNARKNCMLVAGATYPAELAVIRHLSDSIPLLVPGIGAQGGNLAAVLAAGLDRRGQGLLLNASRSIIFAESPRRAAQTLHDSINALRE